MLEFFLEIRGLEIVAAVLLVVGAMLWKKQKWPWLFVGAVIITIGSAVQLPLPSGAITNAFELILLISIIATKAFQDRNDPSAPRAVDTAPPGRH